MSMPVVKTPTGRYLVQDQSEKAAGRAVAYCRVSSSDQRGDLERQAGRVVTAATTRYMVDVLTTMCARLYGRRSARLRAEAALRAAGDAA